MCIVIIKFGIYEEHCSISVFQIFFNINNGLKICSYIFFCKWLYKNEKK